MEEQIVLSPSTEETVADGSMVGVREAVGRLRFAGENRTILVPDARIPVAVAALREAGLCGWVRGLSGRREWYVPVAR